MNIPLRIAMTKRHRLVLRRMSLVRHPKPLLHGYSELQMDTTWPSIFVAILLALKLAISPNAAERRRSAAPPQISRECLLADADVKIRPISLDAQRRRLKRNVGWR